MSAVDVRLVCFDLGRVLVPICDNWQHASQVAKLPVPLPRLDDATRAALREHVFAAEVGTLDIHRFCDNASQIMGIKSEHVAAMSDIYLMGVFPGVGELLDDLSRAGYATACLSNTNDNHWRIAFEADDPAYAELKRLNHRFGSHLIGKRKPDPGIYAHVEQAVGVRGDQIVFFDDLPENIEGARQRGWISEQIFKEPNPVDQMRKHLIRLGVLRD